MSRIAVLRLFWAASLVVLFSFAIAPSEANSIPMPNGSRLEIELANTPDTRQQGLSGRTDLSTDSGMLFVFDSPLVPAFWMKDMQFDLDIVWIDETGMVVGVEERLQPESFPTTVSPETPILFVLEVNGGQAARLGLAAGAELDVGNFLLVAPLSQ